MIDIRGSSGLGPQFVDEDFLFKVGNDSSPDTWDTIAEASPPIPTPTMTIREGEGEFGSDRITFTWPEGKIEKRWLQVTMNANQFTGLSTPDVHYWGSAIGETGNEANKTLVDAQDTIDTRDNGHFSFNRAGIEDAYDFNRDTLVNADDIIIARDNGAFSFNSLKLITPPTTPPPPPPMAIQAVFAEHAGDVDGDNDIDFTDFLILSSNFGNQEAEQADGDLNDDGTVGFDDFLLLAANFGRQQA